MSRVLLAEDNRTLREDITLVLQLRGYQVTQAASGQQLLDLLGEDQRLPDIVIVDVSLQNIDVFEWVERLRTHERLRTIPVLFLSAFNSPDLARVRHKLHMDDVVVKPFQADDLVMAIEKKLKPLLDGTNEENGPTCPL